MFGILFSPFPFHIISQSVVKFNSKFYNKGIVFLSCPDYSLLHIEERSFDSVFCVTDNREQVNSDLAELHLDDETVEILKSNRINNRLLCEIIRHPEFENLMADIAIYIDGLATQGIVNMNCWLEMLRTQILTQYHPDEKDINLRMTEKAQIEEEDYFFHVTHEDWEKILRDLRKEHMGDTEVRPVGDHISQRVLTAFQNAMRQSNPIEAYWRVYCQEMEIPYDKLSKEEHETMIGENPAG